MRKNSGQTPDYRPRVFHVAPGDLDPGGEKALTTDRKTLIGRDHGPYNRPSVTGECGKGVFAREARRAGPAVRPVCSLAVSVVRTVERSVR